MFAAILICSITIISCSKKKSDTPTPTPTPAKQTVLKSMIVTGMSFYDNITYTYEYDDNKRVVNENVKLTENDEVLWNFNYTYGDGQIIMNGTSEDSNITINCTLDSEGRIITMEESYMSHDTVISNTHFEYTYNENGYLAEEYRISDEGVTNYFSWENNEIVSIATNNDYIVVDFELSDAPAQALFDHFSYNGYFTGLCPQGYFGKLPTHMPSKRTITVTLPIPGVEPVVTTDEYTYTLDENGRLATCKEVDYSNKETNYTFIWEEI